MTSKQGYGPDLRKYVDKRISIKLNGKRTVKGLMIGYDHFMNISLDKAVDVSGKEEIELGKTIIRGNSILMWECLDKI